MEEFITDIVLRFGYLAVFVLMLLESACIPIPSEITMLFGGALANRVFVEEVAAAGAEPLDFWLVALMGAVGNLVGSWLAYWVGLMGGRPMIDRWGKYVLLRQHDVERAERWFERYGEAIVFTSRLLPVVRTFISLPAGVARMPFWRFTIYTFLGCIPWSIALAWGGFALGSRWHLVDRYMRPVMIVVAVLVLAAVAWWVIVRLGQRRRARESEGGA